MKLSQSQRRVLYILKDFTNDNPSYSNEYGNSEGWMGPNGMTNTLDSLVRKGLATLHPHCVAYRAKENR